MTADSNPFQASSLAAASGSSVSARRTFVAYGCFAMAVLMGVAAMALLWLQFSSSAPPSIFDTSLVLFLFSHVAAQATLGWSVVSRRNVPAALALGYVLSSILLFTVLVG